MNAKDSISDPKKPHFTITLKAAYAVGYVGIESTRTVADTFAASPAVEIETLVDNSFKDVVERMSYKHLFSEEDRHTFASAIVTRVQKEARKRVLDAVWGKMRDGFCATVSFSKDFDPYESEISGIPTTLEITVSEANSETNGNANNEEKDPSEGQHTDLLSDSDILKVIDSITQTLKLLTHCAKSKDAINRSDMLDYIDDLKSGLDSVLKDETKAS